MQSLMILGRQPALGIAELESLYGADAVEPAGSQAALLDVDPCLVAFDRLGGTVKFAKVLTMLDTTDWDGIESFLIQVAPGHAEKMPEGKMQLGLSVYGMRVNPKRLLATGLTLKKAIRATGRPVRLVSSRDGLELNTAQVTHNNLTGENGWELLFVRHGKQTVVAQTVKVQDIESYTLRDRGRPKRDSRVGMLPPKLAQIIINVAVGRLPEEQLSSICEIPRGQARPTPNLGKTILDPFCGTGVVLLEAKLMGYGAYGTDLEPRMVEYSDANLQWLNQQFELSDTPTDTAVGDATEYQWNEKVDFVAGETYLGRPFTALPAPHLLNQTIADVNLILKKFLQNIAPQVAPGTRFCLAVPAWQIRPHQFRHLPLLDQISDMGYNPISFEHVRSNDLIYHREDQVVARQLLVLEKV